MTISALRCYKFSSFETFRIPVTLRLSVIFPDMTISTQSLFFPFRRPEDRARLAEGLRRAGMRE